MQLHGFHHRSRPGNTSVTFIPFSRVRQNAASFTNLFREMQLLIAVLSVLSICTSFVTPQVSIECELCYTSTGSVYCCGQQGAGVVPVENEKYYGTCPPPLPLDDCPIVFSGVKPDIQADQRDNQFQNIRSCSSDFACANLEKCCFDPCSQLNICKPFLPNHHLSSGSVSSPYQPNPSLTYPAF